MTWCAEWTRRRVLGALGMTAAAGAASADEGATDETPDWFYPEWAARAPNATPIRVRDTESALGRYALKTKQLGLKDLARFHGHYYGGAGIGPAFIVLWVAPATSILALVYTGSILGGGMVLARIVAAVVAWYARRTASRDEIATWLRESWWFVRIIFPLLLGGVFLVGVIGKLLPETWIRTWLGGSGLQASFLATLIGAISYFATMTEAPFVDTLMKLGMGPGPALVLLLTGPGLSLPNWLAIARVFGGAQGGGLRRDDPRAGHGRGMVFRKFHLREVMP